MNTRTRELENRAKSILRNISQHLTKLFYDFVVVVFLCLDFLATLSWCRALPSRNLRPVKLAINMSISKSGLIIPCSAFKVVECGVSESDQRMLPVI